jgi:UDP-2,3-diacylglucosamine pyrophosphatase LpxH
MIRFISKIIGILVALLAIPMIGSALAENDMRPIYVISDLHMGVGKAGGDWNVLEDFRWPRAFDGFLKQLSKDHPNGVNLVIAGDFLELWQHPTVACANLQDTDCGCSLEEMKQIVREVIAGHQSEFESLGRFLSNTRNRVILLPGNHDAALMEDEIWGLVVKAFPSGRERLSRVNSTTWLSEDGKIAIEHGHQFAFDINRYPDWPDVITKVCNGDKRFFRTGGENFVQTLYNKKEAEIPLIDNLVPEAIGISIYSQYSDLKGKKVEDISRLFIFLLLETSLYQKMQFLEIKHGLSMQDKATIDKTIDFCRQCVGEDLVLSTEEGQTIRALAGITSAEQEKALRLSLREQMASLDENAFRELCLRAADRSKGFLKPNPNMEKDPKCSKPLGYGISKLIDPKGEHVRKTRIDQLNRANPGMRMYVFGHTHDATISEDVTLRRGKTVKAFNTGAFQRLMNKQYFDQNRQAGEDDVKLVGRLTHDDMKPCYPALEILYDEKGIPTAQLKQWYQTEVISGNGKFLDACSEDCSARPANCH